ncbi:MAG: GEVED domain-containing protein [Bacteroidota bacterium]
MKICTTICAILFFGAQFLTAQNIKIGNDGSSTADPSSILELDGSASQGMYVPQMTAAQRSNFGSLLATSPDNGEGMMVYQTDEETGLYYWEGSRWIKYKPFGYSGIVGTNWDTISNAYVYTEIGTGFTALETSTGNFDITFDTPFNNYPTITLTPEANKFPLPEDLPLIDPLCDPNYIADCSSTFNASHIEAFRVESFVDLDGTGPNPGELQVIQNGEGFLPPTGANANDIWPYPTNANSGIWMSTGIGFAPGLPATGDYVSQLAGGAWGGLSGCSTNGQDPCVIQNGTGNHGKYYPNVDITSNSFCNQIYHPADQSANQANQFTIRLGKGPNDFFKVFLESTRDWPDEMVVWVDWNRDGDFVDAGETIGWVPMTPSGQVTNGNFSMPHQVPVEPGALMGPTSAPAAGQHAVPADAELGLTTMRILADWLVVNLVNQPCITSVWGESEDYVVEIYDATQGSVLGLGNDFVYTPTVCGISEVKQVAGNYTGFRVECTDIDGNPINTKIHFDVTKYAIY